MAKNDRCAADVHKQKTTSAHEKKSCGQKRLVFFYKEVGNKNEDFNARMGF